MGLRLGSATGEDAYRTAGFGWGTIKAGAEFGGRPRAGQEAYATGQAGALSYRMRRIWLRGSKVTFEGGCFRVMVKVAGSPPEATHFVMLGPRAKRISMGV